MSDTQLLLNDESRNSVGMFLCFHKCKKFFFGRFKVLYPPSQNFGEEPSLLSQVVYAPSYHRPPLEGPIIALAMT